MFFGTWAGYILRSLLRPYLWLHRIFYGEITHEGNHGFVCEKEREFFRRGDSVIFCFQICFKTVLHFTNAAGNFRHDDFLPRNLLHKDADKDGTEKIFHETCLNPVRMFCFCKTRCFCHEPQVKIESVIHAAPEITECRVVDAVFLIFNKCKGIGFNDSDFLFIWKLRQYVSFKKGNDIAVHFYDGY